MNMRKLALAFGVTALGISSAVVGLAAPAWAHKSDAPVVTSVVPDHGSVDGGATVTIRGKNLITATAVDFGSTPAANFTPVSADVLSATSPAGTGTVDITVTTPAGVSTTGPGDQFTYVTTPAIQKVSPRSGLTAGGNQVTIVGSDFTGATQVDFGSTSAAFVVDSDQAITATAPAEPVGTVDVTVTGPDGTSPIDPADNYTYVFRLPEVKSVTPNNGPASGGTTVTIAGSGFTKVSAVDFGSTPATTFKAHGARSITAVAPAGSGTVDVTVTNNEGTSLTNPGDEYTYNPPES